MDAKQCRNPALLHIVRKRDYSLDLGKVAVIEPVYLKADGSGRPPVGVKRMLRCIACNNGSTCRIRPSKKRCMTHAPCGVKGHPNVPSYGHRNSPP
jgi:hypothetical protein